MFVCVSVYEPKNNFWQKSNSLPYLRLISFKKITFTFAIYKSLLHLEHKPQVVYSSCCSEVVNHLNTKLGHLDLTLVIWKEPALAVLFDLKSKKKDPKALL